MKSNKSVTPHEPKGTRFYSQALSKEMMLVNEGPWAGWLAYKHPDGQWVSFRKATQADHHELGDAISKAHHCCDEAESANAELNDRRNQPES